MYAHTSYPVPPPTLKRFFFCLFFFLFLLLCCSSLFSARIASRTRSKFSMKRSTDATTTGATCGASRHSSTLRTMSYFCKCRASSRLAAKAQNIDNRPRARTLMCCCKQQHHSTNLRGAVYSERTRVVRRKRQFRAALRCRNQGAQFPQKW